MNKVMKNKTIQNILQIFTYLPFFGSIGGAVLLFLMPFFPILTRVLIIASAIIISSLLIYLSIRFLKKQSKKGFISIGIVSLLIFTGIMGVDYYYYRIMSSIDQMISDGTEYHVSYLVSLKNSGIETLNDLKGKKIGFLSDESLLVNVAIKEELAKQKFTNFTEDHFPNYINIYEALVSKEIDAMVLDSTGESTIKELYADFKLQIVEILTVQTEMDSQSNNKGVDVTSEPFTMLINGVDIRSGNLNQMANADVIMLATFNPDTRKLLLTSIPRDTFVHVPCRTQSKDKITHSGSGGINCTMQAIEEAFDVTVNYYVKVNFFAVVDLVDELGGITVDVPKAFCEQDSHDNPDTICLQEGVQTINGEEALAFSRHRKTLPQGDIGRGANQQRVIEGIISKLASGKVISSFDRLLSVVSSNIQTNLDKEEMYGFYQLVLSIGANSMFSSTSALQINSLTVSGEGRDYYTDWLGDYLYYYVPYKESMESITKHIKQVIGSTEYDLPSKSFSFDGNKEYIQAPTGTSFGGTLNVTADDYYVPETLPNFAGKTLSYIQTWCNNRATIRGNINLACAFIDTNGKTITNHEATFVSINYPLTPYSRTRVLARPYLRTGTNTLNFVMNDVAVVDPEPSEPTQPTEPTNPTGTLELKGNNASVEVYASAPGDVNAEVKRLLQLSASKGTVDITNQLSYQDVDKIQWTVPGTYTVKVTATDSDNNSITKNFTITLVAKQETTE